MAGEQSSLVGVCVCVYANVCVHVGVLVGLFGWMHPCVRTFWKRLSVKGVHTLVLSMIENVTWDKKGGVVVILCCVIRLQISVGCSGPCVF